MRTNPFFKSLFEKTALKRKIFFMVSDTVLFSFALYLSLYFRFEGTIPQRFMDQFYIYAFIFLTVKIICFNFFQIYRFTWSYVGLCELLKLFKVQVLSSLVVSALILSFGFTEIFRGFPRSIFIIDFVFSLIMAGGLRISKRVFLQGRKYPSVERKNTLIIGAGNAGEQIVRDMQRANDSPYIPVAFIDDNPAKRKVSIHDVRVHGNRSDIPRTVKKLDVELAVIAMPSVPSKEIRNIVSHLHEAGIQEIHIIPGTKEIISRKISVLDIKKIDLEDLLGRRPVQIKYSQVETNLKGQSVLITGAGGSIGSELSRQVARFHPGRLILLDMDETALFHINREMKDCDSGVNAQPVLGDILDKEKMAYIFQAFKPDVVFHAAAYKHVPIVEDFPEEAIKVNILGTRFLAELSYKHRVKRFIFISTDKVVNPTSVMGASKRVAEMVITSLNHQEITKFIAVRFGNVLGSRGSAIPIFQEQIRQGGPVTITHPDMRRYFMTIPEAVLLVLQAGTMGKGGDVFVLDMGEPVKIYDIACELIRLSGLEPEKEMPIVFTGVRPGEKLFEELLASEEGVEKTTHPKIFKAHINETMSQDILFERVHDLKNFSQLRDVPSMIRTFQQIVPTYTPNRPKAVTQEADHAVTEAVAN